MKIEAIAEDRRTETSAWPRESDGPQREKSWPTSGSSDRKVMPAKARAKVEVKIKPAKRFATAGLRT